jgi:hypothetical protein
MKNETLLRVPDRGATAYGTTSVEYHKLLSSTNRFANSWLYSNPKHDYDKLSNQCVQDNYPVDDRFGSLNATAVQMLLLPIAHQFA